MSRLSMIACSSFSSARYVRSTCAPVRTFFSFVRTNAPPLPGLTCWNSTMLNSPSGRSRVMPFFKSLVETAIPFLTVRRSAPSDQCDGLAEGGERAGALLGHDQRVLDPDPTDPGQVHA